MTTPRNCDRPQALAGHREIPTLAECHALLVQHRVPDAVMRHSRFVAALAGRMADALIAARVPLSADLVRAGALLHDLAKGQPKHAESGAATLRAWGMPQVAAVVAAHMRMEFDGTLDERALVYLADKLAQGDQLVTVERRFRPKLLRFANDRKAREAVQGRKAVAEQIAAAVATRLGVPLPALLQESLQSTGEPTHAFSTDGSMEKRP